MTEQKNKTTQSGEAQKCEYKIDGMHCPACEILIKDKISELPNVKNVEVSLNKNTVSFELTTPETNTDSEPFDEEKLKLNITEKIKTHGYKLHHDHATGNQADKDQVYNKKSVYEYTIAILITIGIFGLFQLLETSGLTQQFNPEKLNLPAVFVFGLIASVSSCAAVVGSIVLAISADFAGKKGILPLSAFHLSRIVSFFILGGIIGILGTTFRFSGTSHIIFSTILFLAMFINGLVLLGSFNFLNKYAVSMPKGFVKKIQTTQNRLAQSSTILTPILLGTLTFFLPCGFTQSMQLYALSTGSFWQGATTMFTFALGTLPALSLVGFISTTISGKYRGVFYKTSGLLIILFASLNFYGALVVAGVISPVF